MKKSKLKKSKKKKIKTLKGVLKKVLRNSKEIPKEEPKAINPEVEKDIKEHIEEEDAGKPKKTVQPEVHEEDKEISHYDIGNDYAYKEEKKEAEYMLSAINERVKGYSDKGADQMPKADKIYEPGEGFEGDYEKLIVKKLEKGKILPTGFRKYLSPMRKRLLEIFSLGAYRNKPK